MQELLDWLEYIKDDRQQRKVRHTLKDILVIVLFATLANADDWVEMAGSFKSGRWGTSEEDHLYRWKNHAFQ